MKPPVKVILGVAGIIAIGVAPDFYFHQRWLHQSHSAQGQRPPSESNPKPTTEHPNANNPAHQSPKSAPAIAAPPQAQQAIKPPTEQPDAAKSRDTKLSNEDDGMSNLPTWVAIFVAIAAVVVAGIQAVIYHKQARIMRSQLVVATTGTRAALKAANAAKASADALPLMERAYLFLSSDTISPKVESNSTLYSSFPDEFYTFDLSYAFHNHGKTPAVISGAAGSVRYFQVQPTDFPDPIASVPEGFVVAADKPSRNWDVSGRVAHSDYLAANPNEGDVAEGYILFTAQVSYRDIFGKTWLTGVCLEYDWGSKSFVVSPNDHLNCRT